MSQGDTPFNPEDLHPLAAELPPGEARVVEARIEDRIAEVILVHSPAGPRVYLNRCRHLPITLDWGDGEVLDESGKLLQCRNHGALFRPSDGLCVAGPCQGLFLIPVEAEVRRDGRSLVSEEGVTRERA
ncbi:MAG: Rieske (2Fe-2S) protein [Candidatus Omnitrophica bacterium]|nr:hypothetical protein [bacterium]NUN98903.1 Rieske (2Fe-2S) protein [Candidatus Omnitrophota bacterium]